MHNTTAIAVEATAAPFQKWSESAQNGYSCEFPRHNDKRNKSLPDQIIGLIQLSHEQRFLHVRNTGA
jgi:hypothetical protein